VREPVEHARPVDEARVDEHAQSLVDAPPERDDERVGDPLELGASSCVRYRSRSGSWVRRGRLPL